MRSKRADIRLHEAWPSLLVLFVCFLIGLIAGFIFVLYFLPDGALSDYLIEYCALLKTGSANISLAAAFKDCFFWPALIALLSATSLCLVGLPILFVIRGFLLSFAGCALVRVFSGEGVVLGAVLFSVPALIVIPVMFVLGCIGLSSAMRKLPNASPVTAKPIGLGVYLVCSGILFISAAVQKAVIPAALSSVCNLLF